ncbi:MAG: hypothetical protein Q7R41_16985, partial [Phycisphaerales bacterium]|nr:hypothetical protein [Phycisphaerales bacterium]
AALMPVAALALALSCGSESPPARTALTPIATIHVPDAIDLGTVSPSTAIETAMQRVESAGEILGVQQVPDQPVARLTTSGNLKSWAGERAVIEGEYSAAAESSLVWAVQIQGRWRAGSNAPGGAPARFALIGIDAHTGEAVVGYVSADPFMAPSRLRGQATFTCVTFNAGDSRVAIGPRQAIDLVRPFYSQGVSKIGSEWDFDRADAETVRCVDTVGGTDYFMFRWFVTVPSRMALYDCSTPSVRQVDLKKRCWSPVATHLVDGVSGELMEHRESELPGPLLTDQEFDQVKRFAESTTWWEAWARLSGYNDSIIPAHTLETLLALPQKP